MARRPLHLSDLVFRKRPIFLGASFLDAVDFTGVNFQNGANFEGATFHGNLIFHRTRLHGADFSRSLFKGETWFQQAAFGYALFSNARFAGPKARFEESSFDGITDFSNAAFELDDDEAVVRFQDIQFKDFLDFEGAAFNNQVSFDNVSFGGTTEFIDTTFKLVKSTVRYRSAAVEFNQIEVMEGANLTFKSTSASKRLFNHDVSFSFKSDPQGTVRFENVNFNEIAPASRKRLTDLARSGKVEIGPGCIKYRFQTEVRSIATHEGHAPLILEIAGTFANYFTARNGIALGLEVVERTSTHVMFFYFTDEDIGEAEFLERLKRTEQDLWNLLAVSPDVFRLLDGSVLDESSTSPKTAIINAVDGVSALIGTFFRVGIRIAVGRWSEADTRSLLEAIRFNPDDIEARAASLHKVILGRYTGRNLVGISYSQNEGLPAINPVGGLLTGYAGAADGGAQPSKVTILFLGANGAFAPLQLEEEVSKIQMNLKMARERENLVFRQEWAVTIDSLMQSILDESPAMIHFSGHGEESGIILQDPYGNPAPVSTEALGSLFRLFKDTISCVVLNSCFSEHQAIAIRAHIPYVIGVRSAIPDSAAIAFSTGFYKGIGAGRGVPFAFELGKVAMELWGVAGEDSAVLL
ncbi:MAG TPA: pentapeptide repeat-containing protein [Thermoanaerobaculia bacterium]|nr:pentapeptide repeat-containing protein [Thermoanaerobaculia bacterium]